MSLYTVLGIDKSASQNDIKKSYLKLARLHHPDKGGDIEKFKEIQKAYEILNDEGKRRFYDETGRSPDEVSNEGPTFHSSSSMPFPFEFDMNNLFNMFGGMGGGPKGPQRKGKKPAPTVQNIFMTLEQLFNGHTVELNINRQVFCKDCSNSGAKKKEICSGCNGRGMVTQMMNIGPMAMQTSGPCTKCEGRGEKIIEKCSGCDGSGYISEKKNLHVKVRPGTRPGEQFTFPEVCSDNASFEKPGDVIIQIMHKEDDAGFKMYKRIGDKFYNLETHITISLSEALVGCTVKLDNHPGFDDGLFCKIPPASFEGDRYCLSGLGMPYMGQPGKYGDLFIIIHVSIKYTERRLLASKGYELLTPLFEDNVRKIEVNEDNLFTDVYLHKGDLQSSREAGI